MKHEIKVGSKWENVHGMKVTVKEVRSGVSPDILVTLPCPNTYGNMWDAFDSEQFAKFYRLVENSSTPEHCDIYPGQRWRTIDGRTAVVTEFKYMVSVQIGEENERFGEHEFRLFFAPVDVRKKPEAA